MTVVGVIAAFMEEGRIGDAVASLLAAGCDRVFVLDGAWIDQDGRPFGSGPALSTDRTVDEASEAGADVAGFGAFIGGDAAKQTALLRQCGARIGDTVIRIDADERLRGTLPTVGEHSLVWLHNHGDNDIPGIRSSWPRGDDSEQPIPLLRAFVYRADLICDRPGRWRTADGPLEPYRVGALAREVEHLHPDDPRSVAYRELRDNEHLLAPAETAAFPILQGAWIDHYRHTAKAEAKTVYYAAA